MPDLALYAAPDLPPHLKYQLLAAVRIAWPWVFSGPARTWDYTVKATNPHYVLMTDQDVLISFAEVNQRVLQLGDTAYTVSGLSAVYTFPAYRREGFGQQVVQAATAAIAAGAADVAMLFCLPALTAFYQASGWQPMPTAHIWYGEPDQPQTLADEVVMLLAVSDTGRQLQAYIRQHPVYVGSYTW